MTLNNADKLLASLEQFKLDKIKCAFYSSEFEERRPIISITKSCFAITGYTSEEFLTHKVSLGELVANEDKYRVWHTIEDASKTGESYHINYRITHKNGTIVWLLEKGYITEDKESICGIIMESFDYLNLLTILQQREELYRDLAEYSKDVLFLLKVKPELKYEYVSPSVKKQLGYDPEELYNNPNLGEKFWHPKNLDLRNKILRGEQISHPIITKLIRKDGQEIYVEQNLHFIRDHDGEIVAIHGISRDITDRIKLEEELKKINEQLEEQVKKQTEKLFLAEKMGVVGKLTSGLAHDFNNILTAIDGALEIFKQDVDDTLKTKMLEIIRSQVQIGQELIGKLLDFAAQKPSNPRPTDVKEILDDLLELFKAQCSGKALLKIERIEPATINIDPVELKQILLNVVKNAVEAIQDFGDVSIGCHIVEHTDVRDIEKRYIRKGQYAEIEIRDTGTGMPNGQVKQLFMPFHSTKGKGRGLGLAQVYGLTRKNNGYIYVISKLNEGTSVKLYFPIYKAKKA